MQLKKNLKMVKFEWAILEKWQELSKKMRPKETSGDRNLQENVFGSVQKMVDKFKNFRINEKFWF